MSRAQLRRATDPARALGDVVGVEDQPAIALAIFTQHPLQLLACQRAVVKLDHLSIPRFDGFRIDAFVDTAAAIEVLRQLELARQRCTAKRIAEIRELQAWTKFEQEIAVFLGILPARPRVELFDANMRKGVTTDLVAANIQVADLVTLDQTPVSVLSATGAAAMKNVPWMP